jgi:DNA-binding transcriptional ArsR family regulator
MKQQETYLPINAMYLSWLRDSGAFNRPGPKAKMDAHDRIIYIMLLTRADNEKLTCFPSIDQICRDTGLDRRTVRDHLSNLEMMGFIAIKKRRGNSNEFFMLDFALWLNNNKASG